MTKYPLFGQDSVPQYTSKFISIIGTVLFWLIFMIVMLCVKPVNKKPKYKEVQIVLSSTPQPVKQPEPVAAPEPAPSAAAQPEPAQVESKPEVIETKTPVAESKPAPAKTVETPKPAPKVEQPKPAPAKPKTEASKAAAKPEPAKPKAEPAKKVEKQPEPTFTGEYVDPMEAFEKQTTKTQKKDFNWDSFEDSADNTAVSNETQKVVTPTPVKSSFSGAAGEVAEQKPAQTKTSSTPANNNKQGTSKGTNTALDAIENTTGKTNAAVQGKAKESDATATTDPNSNLKFKGGAARKLLVPKVPNLKVSKENQDKVNSSEVQITFTVDSQGYVVGNSISTNPPISQSVLDEITEQISGWWFDSGDGNVTATFVWKIQRN